MPKGMFLVIEGPNGAGKSNICRKLVERLSDQGRKVHLVCEPSQSPIGELVKIYREQPNHILTLACLIAADRYANLIEDIRPKKSAGYIVISDRYVPSNFVYQILHGLPETFLLAINSFIDKPDLTIIIETDHEVLRARIENDRKSNSFSENIEMLEKEIKQYADVDNVLCRLGHPTLRLRNDLGNLNSVVDAICKKVEELETEIT
jgi:dTMP kinase